MIDMLDPSSGETIYDPACGTGGMLLLLCSMCARSMAMSSCCGGSSTGKKRTSQRPRLRA
jgi:N-6 DNA Methylase